MIILRSERQRVMQIRKKTSAKMFKNVKEGDVLLFQIALKPVGSGDRGTYAAGITCILERTGETTIKTFNELPKILSHFELEIATEYNEIL